MAAGCTGVVQKTTASLCYELKEDIPCSSSEIERSIGHCIELIYLMMKASKKNGYLICVYYTPCDINDILVKGHRRRAFQQQVLLALRSERLLSPSTHGAEH